MATIKEVVLLGSTFSAGFRSVLGNADIESNNYDDTPLNPDSAFAELWDVTAQAFVNLGSLGPSGRGAAAAIDGNTITYTIPKTAVTTAGDYVLIVTAQYSSPTREVSQRRPLKYKERR